MFTFISHKQVLGKSWEQQNNTNMFSSLEVLKLDKYEQIKTQRQSAFISHSSKDRREYEQTALLYGGVSTYTERI